MGYSQKERIWNLLRDIQTKQRLYFYPFNKRFGLSIQDGYLIREISLHPGITLSQLSELLGLSKSTLSSMVSRLEEKGVLIREIPHTNRRIVQLRISPEFKQNPEIASLKSQLVNGFVQDMSQEDADTILSGLEKLNELIGEIADVEGYSGDPQALPPIEPGQSK